MRGRLRERLKFVNGISEKKVSSWSEHLTMIDLKEATKVNLRV